ncbi:hypothetical protein DAKH74_049230 [Maudiozyma humilis]|uniref:Uncharacterized protein n=1 Tax=Maudiozyma humilis TaxID=51915 RepID=A0AAV5S3I6_MAUHU|nr:hypothetical protein DAKH74_049230 [Kazachstania humilis]
MFQTGQDQRAKRGNAHFEIEAPLPELPRKRARYDAERGPLPISPVLSAVQHSSAAAETAFQQGVVTPAVSPANMHLLAQQQVVGDNDIYSEAEEYMVMGYYHDFDQQQQQRQQQQQPVPAQLRTTYTQSTSPSPASSSSNIPMHYNNTTDYRTAVIQQTAAPYSLYDLTNEEIEMMNIQQQQLLQQQQQQQQQQFYMQDEQMQY